LRQQQAAVKPSPTLRLTVDVSRLMERSQDQDHTFGIRQRRVLFDDGTIERLVKAEVEAVAPGLTSEAIGYAGTACTWGTVTSCEPRGYRVGRRGPDEIIFYVGFDCTGANSGDGRPMRGQVFIPRNLVKSGGTWVRGDGWKNLPYPVVEHGEWYTVEH